MTIDKQSPASWPENDDEREFYIDWINSVNDENTCLGFRDWLKEVGEDCYDGTGNRLP